MPNQENHDVASFSVLFNPSNTYLAIKKVQPAMKTQATTYGQQAENDKAAATYAPQSTKKLTLNRETIRLLSEDRTVNFYGIRTAQCPTKGGNF